MTEKVPTGRYLAAPGHTVRDPDTNLVIPEKGEGVPLVPGTFLTRRLAEESLLEVLEKPAAAGAATDETPSAESQSAGGSRVRRAAAITGEG